VDNLEVLSKVFLMGESQIWAIAQGEKDHIDSGSLPELKKYRVQTTERPKQLRHSEQNPRKFRIAKEEESCIEGESTRDWTSLSSLVMVSICL
jgi:hypothetical protein